MIKHPDRFQRRHIGPTPGELDHMLSTVGVDSLDDLIGQTVPAKIRLEQPLEAHEALSEHEYLRALKQSAAKNQVFKNYIGLGYYGTVTPSVILRNIFENPGWYTQYTPYQAEISQGRLEALLNFQTMVSDLTGLPIANASLLDEGTAAAEAMAMTYGQKRKKDRKSNANVLLVASTLFPQTIEVLKTRAEAVGIELRIAHPSEFVVDESVFGAVVQYPDNNGEIHGYQALADELHAQKGYLIVAADIMSLLNLEAPASFGADVVVGNTQRFGVPMGFGGPHAAYFATSNEFLRLLPGRIIGVSVDRLGNAAMRMTLQTREQHIRRDKATSNICTAQALLAIMAGMYAVYHGPTGLQAIATRIHRFTATTDKALKALGLNQQNSSYFDTLRIEADVEQQLHIRELAEARGINLRYDDGFVGISLDETTEWSDVEGLVNLFAAWKGVQAPELDLAEANAAISPDFIRKSEFLTHPVFNSHHSETAMMRYIKSLENKDLSLNAAMIPLGSCTMKLNAATELIPVSWPEFSQIHPFAPENQTQGYKEIITELENRLCDITGFAGMSFQPNSGAQGEFAGLLVIRAYHHSRGDHHRNIALIPSSAHGTNPASAVMAGMKVVVVKCDDQGNIDVADLKAKAEQHKDNLSSLMITYPSTHGVFEETIMDICQIIHDNGGQVYMDGANMNAQVGLTSPGRIGADVCHLNLHKTFAIPHGGGGPGVGPIGVAAHLKPFLPGHGLSTIGTDQSIPAVSAAPFGSASILLISYAYLQLLGSEGSKAASEYAILNANYMKSRLEEAYPVLFQGTNGRVAHEFILDLRQFKASLGLEVDDITKRLIDYGFHAPTVSWPVPGTIMVEPTESEPLSELDRFCDAMLSIREEIRELENGLADADDNVLKNAPHTMAEVTSDGWAHAYSRQKAAFPVPSLYQNKFWPSVARVNNTFGDRNVVCTCPPLEAYAEEAAN
ncbi:aminomethyl-transferring glycine dehydrogenase [Pontibacter sp. G13]|uniref:aminomethyl-transferring glycine dehydrogenase n=1 Tax=Pontibacter sp. G13 TaxID=3074898 RepID=UPI00288B8A8F|nr:aminomethyl-transferring glycine dehydrogenase [Pontibacter sp. G13]WNJ20512.1 aminomethyl-transferring glycine dehydrogenase [Pontibacter sp. G13]